MTDAKFKLEDILNKKKAPPQILDLANLKLESEDEFRNVLEKIPDYKIKPERPEETREQMEMLSRSLRRFRRLRQRQGHKWAFRLTQPFTDLGAKKLEDTLQDMGVELHTRDQWRGLFIRNKLKGLVGASASATDEQQQREETDAYLQYDKSSAADAVTFSEDRGLATSRTAGPASGTGAVAAKKASFFCPQPPYQFADPCPASMRNVKISDLSSVDINWKMLTLARPASKTDEEIFSKLVLLDKLRLQTRVREAEQALVRGGKDPFIVVKNPSASKGGVAETSIKVCSECSEEFCSGTCKEFQYDAYQRLILAEKEKEAPGAGGAAGGAGNEAGAGKRKKRHGGGGGGARRKAHRKKHLPKNGLSKMPVDIP